MDRHTLFMESILERKDSFLQYVAPYKPEVLKIMDAACVPETDRKSVFTQLHKAAFEAVGDFSVTEDDFHEWYLERARRIACGGAEENAAKRQETLPDWMAPRMPQAEAPRQAEKNYIVPPAPNTAAMPEQPKCYVVFCPMMGSSGKPCTAQTCLQSIDGGCAPVQIQPAAPMTAQITQAAPPAQVMQEILPTEAATKKSDEPAALQPTTSQAVQPPPPECGVNIPAGLLLAPEPVEQQAAAAISARSRRLPGNTRKLPAGHDAQPKQGAGKAVIMTVLILAACALVYVIIGTFLGKL